MKIGEKIVFLRRKKGITQAELADQLHFTRQAVSNWERGITEPDAHTLSVIAAYFGISTDELLGISSERQSYASAIGTDMDHVRYGFDIGNDECERLVSRSACLINGIPGSVSEIEMQRPRHRKPLPDCVDRCLRLCQSY